MTENDTTVVNLPPFPVTTEQRGTITAAQYEMLMRPLREARVAHRSQGGKQLSYLEAWDVKAHLTRAFGFGNWDLEMLDYHFIESREYMTNPQQGEPKPMVEVIYAARMQLTIRDPHGALICRHSEGAVGSASGPRNMLGEHHDNALKTAASDATKRCAINMGTQFGLSLYDNGSLREVIRQTVVVPEGYTPPEPTKEQAKALADSVGSVTEPEAPDSVPDGDGVRTA
jgi:recombination DNA repair RAD52 pathway protein